MAILKQFHFSTIDSMVDGFTLSNLFSFFISPNEFQKMEDVITQNIHRNMIDCRVGFEVACLFELNPNSEDSINYN